LTLPVETESQYRVNLARGVHGCDGFLGVIIFLVPLLKPLFSFKQRRLRIPYQRTVSFDYKENSSFLGN
jgi:hypothetical protein